VTERCEHPCGSIRCESYGFAGRPTCTSPDPSSRLEEIRARHARTTPRYYDDVGWLLEHVEQLQAEVERLSRLHADGCVQTIESLRHAVQQIGDAHDASMSEVAQLRRQRQVLLDLCDGPNRLKNRTLAASAVRTALGVSSS